MKQHITSEQLEALSPKAQEKLREWWMVIVLISTVELFAAEGIY